MARWSSTRGVVLLFALFAGLVCAMLGGADAAPALMMRRNTGTDDSFTKRHYGGHMISAKLRDDPCEPLTDEASCSASPACVWCKAQAIPSSCFRKEDAAKLPPGVFVCS
mmetsp:Transcript_17942/g.45466  ORF Transcript_17942/g.45466 Transcript_17942/m.45466 type:complete len:110 (-) Transcript_17942:176-505(-)|eukprot:jgi/Tetstr1/459713/TSEL_005066.t1